MEGKVVPVTFSLGRQSSLAKLDGLGGIEDDEESLEELDEIDPTFQLMYLTNECDLEGINELLDSGINVNFRDEDGRTPLHIAACQGVADVVDLLLQRGAEIDPEDRWGSTPLADAIYYKNHNVKKLLEQKGAKPLVAPMHVNSAGEVPEYEIDPSEIDFTNSVYITKGTFRIASWRGIQVAVKELPEDVISDGDKVKAFRDELALLQRIRHPNVVQFLGAVTQSSPMMIVTEYLPKGDLRAYLTEKGALKPATAVKFALDIARGMNYLHEQTPEAIIHRDLEPSNILRDDTGHLKVADFGVSKLLKVEDLGVRKLLKVTNTIKEDKPLACEDTSCRYVAPEVFRNDEYDMKVDVFSFALILHEMIEGHPPFDTKQEDEVANAYVARERPAFKASAKLYSHGLKQLIEECWNEVPEKRPTFRVIIGKLNAIYKSLGHKRRWKARAKSLRCFHLEAMWKRDPSSHSSTSSTNH